MRTRVRWRPSGALHGVLHEVDDGVRPPCPTAADAHGGGELGRRPHPVLRDCAVHDPVNDPCAEDLPGSLPAEGTVQGSCRGRSHGGFCVAGGRCLPWPVPRPAQTMRTTSASARRRQGTPSPTFWTSASRAAVSVRASCRSAGLGAGGSPGARFRQRSRAPYPGLGKYSPGACTDRSNDCSVHNRQVFRPIPLKVCFSCKTATHSLEEPSRALF